MVNKIIDISVPIEQGMAVYPKNPEVVINTLNTGHSTISKIEFGSHTGTHVDAPRHISAEGQSVDEIPLDVFMGPCRVLDMTHVEKGISDSDLMEQNIQKGERILVKTKNSSRGYRNFYDDYIFLEGAASDYLATVGIFLFGIDYLSVKEKGSKDNRAHTSMLNKGIVIFEGLVLTEVSPGNYTFFGLPLKITADIMAGFFVEEFTIHLFLISMAPSNNE